MLIYVLTLSSFTIALAQERGDKIRLAVGISAPEMLNFGLGVDISKSNQLGFYGGIGPSMNAIWTSLNLEHRWYFGKFSDITKRRQWFFRQGYTYYPSGNGSLIDDSVVTMTFGKDLKSKKSSKGWTIDLGLFYRLGYVRESESEPGAIIPALRFQYYGFLKNKSN